MAKSSLVEPSSHHFTGRKDKIESSSLVLKQALLFNPDTFYMTELILIEVNLCAYKLLMPAFFNKLLGVMYKYLFKCLLMINMK